jgi:type I restriction enzyme R subunit
MLINQIKTSNDPDYCQRVTANDGALGDQWLRDFQDNEKTIPTILTTSQKLSTGVDARNVRNIVLLRPVNSMIEFKQIIGRGTRLYDGKDYFTIYDFVKAHHHFNDPDWDGEPVEPENCKQCGCYPCVCVKEPPPPLLPLWQHALHLPAGALPGLRAATLHLQEEDESKGQTRGRQGTQDHVHFRDDLLAPGWHANVSAAVPRSSVRQAAGVFRRRRRTAGAMERSGNTPKAAGWPGREGLRQGTTGRDAEGHRRPRTATSSTCWRTWPMPRNRPDPRGTCGCRAKAVIDAKFNSRQQAFLSFVLSHYVEEGVEELDQAKLTPLLKLRYHDSMKDALDDLGQPEEIRRVFSGFQKYLYEEQV